MFFKVSWDEDFDSLMMHLWGKYGKELFTLDGIGEQMDINKFSKNFFNREGNATADVSVDGNANVTQKSSIEYNFEMPKPLRRYNSYYLLWKQLRKMYGLQIANEIIESQLRGDIYINDFSDIASPYCFNYSTYDIALGGLEGLSTRPVVKAPKSLDVFIRQIEQFMVVAANSTLGATGFADMLIVASHYVSKIIETGYDGHIRIFSGMDNDKMGLIKAYLHEKFVEFIYTVNWSFRGNQSPFSNLSVYDDAFLDSLCPDYTMDGKPADKSIVKWMQEIYLDAMNAELERTLLTFPVTTACFCTDDNDEIIDKKFARLIAEKNMKFGFINIYNGKSSTLSSCCRLRSNRDNQYFNSFGAGSTKIGSLGVVTANLPRAAVKAINKEDEDKNEAFLEELYKLFDIECKVNAAKRKLVDKRIKLGAAPLYTYGYMDLKKQYSTFGISGLYEAVKILGYDVLSEEGQNVIETIMKKVNSWIDGAEREYGAPHNCEQVPAENSSIKLAKKDTMLGYNVLECPFYSNQFIPLITKANMLDRIRIQGRFDKLFSGGAICHVNVSEEIKDPEHIVSLMEYAAKKGVVYWAINYRIRICAEHHSWVGSDICPVCGKPWEEEATRVVGFFTYVKNWAKERREHDWPNRQFYTI